MLHKQSSNDLIEHLFRNEYGKMLSVVSKYVDIDAAEDIVQETLLAATDHWQLNSIPPNPQAWLYKTAKNKTLNFLRRKNHEREFLNGNLQFDIEEISFSDEQISDEQLRMMLNCCHSSLSSDITITLILKILCGFSISEIASAFCTNTETINKRLVRGRKTLKVNFTAATRISDLNENLEVLLKAIYLFFNEGYLPAKINQTVRKDLCLEAIRLAEIIVNNKDVPEKGNVHSLLALMYLNCSRVEARMNQENDMIEIELQNRRLWNQDLINRGLHHLRQAQQEGFISKYMILAGISGVHCVARNYGETDWKEILSLYNALLVLDHSPLVKLNRIVALSRAVGTTQAINELQSLQELKENHLFHSVMAELKRESGKTKEAISCFKKAIELATNPRDRKFLEKKLSGLVPIPATHV